MTSSQLQSRWLPQGREEVEEPQNVASIVFGYLQVRLSVSIGTLISIQASQAVVGWGITYRYEGIEIDTSIVLGCQTIYGLDGKLEYFINPRANLTMKLQDLMTYISITQTYQFRMYGMPCCFRRF